jgi:hypothetical protein
MYLTISGKNKTDPEILHWIAKFLTGPKKTYLVYLMNNYGYRIRLRNPQGKDGTSLTPQVSQPKSIGRSVSLQNLKSQNPVNPTDSASTSLSTESATGATDARPSDPNSDLNVSGHSLEDSKSTSSSQRNSDDWGNNSLSVHVESPDEDPIRRPSPVVSPFESPAYMNRLKVFSTKKAKFDIWNEPSPRDREVLSLPQCARKY